MNRATIGHPQFVHTYNKIPAGQCASKRPTLDDQTDLHKHKKPNTDRAKTKGRKEERPTTDPTDQRAAHTKEGASQTETDRRRAEEQGRRRESAETERGEKRNPGHGGQVGHAGNPRILRLRKQSVTRRPMG